MKIFFNFFAFPILMAHSLLNFEIIFSLREYFSSDVILLAVKENNFEIAKQIFKYESSSPKAFLGVINLDTNIDESILRSQIYKFQNIIIASDVGEDFIKKMIKLQLDLSHLMASLVLVLFEQNDVTAQLNNFYIPSNYKFLLINKNYEILDVYQIGVNGSKIYSHFSNWDNGKKPETSIKKFFPRRTNLKGHVFNVMHVPGHRYTKYRELFSEIMNFTIKHTRVEYGGILSNGTKFGIFQQLDNHSLDLTNHNFKFSPERAEYFDYIFPATTAETKMYVAVNQDVNWSSFIAPFTIEIWIAVFLYIVVASIIMIMINKFSVGNNKSDISFFNILGAFLYQGGTSRNSSISFYMSYLLSYILGLVMVQAYSGVFSSFLTVKKFTLPFNNLKEIIQVGSHKILVENHSYPLFYFREDQGKETTYIRNNLLLPQSEFPDFADKIAGFHETCRRKVIYVTSSSDDTINAGCDIAILKENLFSDVEGIITWRGFPYKDIMNDLMKKIQSAGLMKVKRKMIIAPNESSKKFQPLTFNSILSIFIVLIFFMIFSVLIFICEKTRKSMNLQDKI